MTRLADIYATQMDALCEDYRQSCRAITDEANAKLQSPSVTADEAKVILMSQADALDLAYSDFSAQVTSLRREFLEDKEAEVQTSEQEDLLNLEQSLKVA